jgi:hypothetical protein
MLQSLSINTQGGNTALFVGLKPQGRSETDPAPAVGCSAD